MHVSGVRLELKVVSLMVHDDEFLKAIRPQLELLK